MDRMVTILKNQIRQQRPAMLVTLTGDSDSAPRSSGACMVVGKTGLLGGTIGGGMLEYKAIERAQKLLEKGCGEFRHYGLNLDSAANLGMVCGGAVDALFTHVAADEINQRILTVMEEAMRAHRPGWILLSMNGQSLGFFCQGTWAATIQPAAPADIESVSKAGVLHTAKGEWYVTPVSSGSRVFIFGGGHLAQEIVPLLTHLQFRCIVTDDRQEFSRPELFPDAEAVYMRDFSQLDGQYDVQRRDYIISVTRGHLGDYEVEKFALKTPASYIGCVGSRKKIAYVNEKLRADQFSDDDIARITSPIGLDIGSETPAEIAVSIAAQLIAHRAAARNDGEDI